MRSFHKNHSGLVENQYLADGIMEDILNRLAHLEKIDVKSRISAEKYRNTSMSCPEIAEEIGVKFILEGSLIKQKNKVRVYVNLIDGKHDTHIWSDYYEEDITDIFTFIESVSIQIVRELQSTITPEETAHIEKNYTASAEAYKLYLKGRFFWHRRTKEDLITSVRYFKMALEKDPEYALAYAGLADSFYILSWWGWYSWDKGIKKSQEFIDKALEIDNNLGEAHTINAALVAYKDWDWNRTEKEFKLALELNPMHATTYQYYSEYLNIMGRNEKALEMIEKALEIHPTSLMMNGLRSHYYFDNGNYKKSISNGQKLLEINKDAWYQYIRNFKNYVYMGKPKEAINELSRMFKNFSPENDYGRDLDLIYRKKGMKGLIVHIIKWMNETGYGHDFTSPPRKSRKRSRYCSLTGI